MSFKTRIEVIFLRIKDYLDDDPDFDDEALCQECIAGPCTAGPLCWQRSKHYMRDGCECQICVARRQREEWEAETNHFLTDAEQLYGRDAELRYVESDD